MDHLEVELNRLATLTPGADIVEELKTLRADFGVDADSYVAEITRRAGEAIRNLDAGALALVRRDLYKALIDLRQARIEAAKPATSGVEERLGAFEAHGYGAIEVDHVRAMLAPGESVTTVDYFAIVTNHRTISRDEVRAYGRPASWSNDRSWTSQFVSDGQVRRLEAEAAERANPRPAHADNFNTDYRNGIRP